MMDQVTSASVHHLHEKRLARSPVYGCLSCPNFTSCRQLKAEEQKLEQLDIKDGSWPASSARKIRVLLDYFQRQRFTFPFAVDYTACWYHDKFGVIENLISYAQKLLRERAA